MKYKGDRFTEEEKSQIIALGNVVARVFGIDVLDLRGKIRKPRFTDARKVLSSITSSNIDIELSKRHMLDSYNHLALASWYLDMDHSSVSYLIDKSAELYSTDKEFKLLYDSVIAMINNPSEELLDRIDSSEHEMDRFVWEDVRSNLSFPHKVRYSLAPETIILEVANLYRRGYSVALIADKYKTLPSFISYVVKMRRVNKIPIGTSLINASRLISRMNATLDTEVKQDYLLTK